RAYAVEAAVPDPYAGDRLADLLAVRTDVLHRGGAHGAGDAGQCFDADPAGGDGVRDEVVPVLAGRDGDLDIGAIDDVIAVDAPHRHPDDGPVEALVGDDEVGAAAEDQDVLVRLVSCRQGRNERSLGGGLD